MTKASLIVPILAAVVAVACAPRGPAAVPQGGDALSCCVLLPLPTATSDGLLGHPIAEGKLAPESSSAQFVAGRPIVNDGMDVTARHMRTFDVQGRVAVGFSSVGAGVDYSQVTNVKYDVRVLGDEKYDGATVEAAAGCCLPDGTVEARCRGGFVTRVIKGTGTFQYLRKYDSAAGVEAPKIVLEGGVKYLLLNELEIKQPAVFAFEVGDAADMCRRAAAAPPAPPPGSAQQPGPTPQPGPAAQPGPTPQPGPAAQPGPTPQPGPAAQPAPEPAPTPAPVE